MNHTEAKSNVVFPKIPPVQAENIPELLKLTKQWIVWRAGPLKENGKFDKVPIHPHSRCNINHLDPKNWSNFEQAIAAYERGVGNGVGFVLSEKHKILKDGTEYHVIAVDLDGVIGRKAFVQEVGLRLGRPYVEFSPSGKGLRMFVLSKAPIRGGNAGEGRELYCDKRFVTVTGWGARGKIKDSTAGILALDKEWFGEKAKQNNRAQKQGLGCNLGKDQPPETKKQIARVKEALSYVSPDLDRNKWRDIVWSILSTGWACAEQIARNWSMEVNNLENAKHVYEDDSFDVLVRDFDPGKGMGIGTLFYHAQNAGFKWTSLNDEALEGEVMDCDEGVSANPLKTLEDFNKRFFVSMIGGGCFIFDEEAENIIGGAMSENAFKLRFKNIHIGEKILTQKWLSWTGRRSYNAVDFNPRGQSSPGTFNIYRGFAVKARMGECELILAHIQNVLCGRNENLYTYVIKWMALAVQRPWIKPQVALVMRSREGAGKSIIAAIFLKIFGQHGFTTASKDAVAGRFNAHLRDKIIVVLEEAFFAGDHAAIAAAKVLITNEDMSYEAKGKDPVSGRNYAHVICLSNHDWAVPAGEDSRRWCVLDVSDEYVGDHQYFKQLMGQIKNGGTEAFLHYLLNLDISQFNFLKFPQTTALADQRRETMLNGKPVDAWIYSALVSEEFARNDNSLEWGAELDADLMRESYKQFIARIPRAPHWAQAVKRMKELLPQGSMTKRRLRDGINRRNVYTLPDIDVARAHFKGVTGVEVVPE